MASCLIRDARPPDAPALGWIHVESWRAAYRGIVPDAYLDSLDPGRRGRDWLGWMAQAEPGTLLVAEAWESGAVVGFAGVGSYRPNPDAETDLLASDGCGELRLLYVDPEAWGSGVGDDLLDAAHDALARHGYRDAALWVFDENPRARRFYERHGWAADGTDLRFEIGGAPVRELRYRRSLVSRPPL